MITWLQYHFSVQQGMYFDKEEHQDQFIYFGSDFIEDSVWNYGVSADVTSEGLKKFVSFCKKINKPCNLYIPMMIRQYNDELFIKEGFSRPTDDQNEIITESWMLFKEKRYQLKCDYKVMQVHTEQQKKDFIEVFIEAYGGGKSAEKPYGDLPESYTLALLRTFSNPKFLHFICYDNDVPVSIATLCFNAGNGGIYNVGTKPAFERRGFGLAVTDACINKWIGLGGKKLFLQTETGTGIDTWYNKIGFDHLFYGAIYEKQ